MIDDILEIFRGQYLTAVYFLVILPVSLSFSPTTTASMQKTAGGVVQELKVFRLQHFDIQGNQHGTRAWRVNFEAVSSSGRHVIRRCLVVSWKELNPETLQQTITANLGAVLIVLPKTLAVAVSDADRKQLMNLEERLLEKSFPVPIYVTFESPTVLDILRNINQQGKSENGSALNAMISAVVANGYQLVTSNQANSIPSDIQMHNIVGKLAAYERADRVSSIAIVAHYDSFGLAPALALGADSNASGMAALLELLRIFSKLYQTSKTRARYNLIFLLSAGGKFNYQGARHWIDEHVEQVESGHNRKLEFAACLDSLGKNTGLLNMHVSKIPKETSAVYRFYEILQNVSSTKTGNNNDNLVNVSMVQKKINLGDEFLAWEHERFSIKKLYAFTLSHYENHRDQSRRSILDRPESIDMDALQENTGLIAEALARHVFDLKDNSNDGGDDQSAADRFLNDLKVERENLETWIRMLTWKSRSAQALAESSTVGGGGKLPGPILNDLLHAVEHYAHETHTSLVKTDKRDPDCTIYGAIEDVMFAYRVKPAIFDLILALLIAGYLGLVYLFVLNAFALQIRVRYYLATAKSKQA